jgi:hypothetical protein
MMRTLARIALALVVCGAVQAVTTNTTLSAFGCATLYLSEGDATLENIGSGFMDCRLTLSTLTVDFTITMTTGTTGTISGSINIPGTWLAALPGYGSAFITGGTANFARAYGSFPVVAGAGGFPKPGLTLAFSGPGTIITAGPIATSDGGGPAVPSIANVLDAASNTPGVAQVAFPTPVVKLFKSTCDAET